jgi:hypothetical protein
VSPGFAGVGGRPIAAIAWGVVAMAAYARQAKSRDPTSRPTPLPRKSSKNLAHQARTRAVVNGATWIE